MRKLTIGESCDMVKNKGNGTLPELLAPAGTPECLFAAVKAGADAVYLGLGAFNARMGAGNFTRDDLAGVVAYCHNRGVRAYLALNTLIKNDELHQFLRDAGFAYGCGVDAVILQDPCLARELHARYPGLTLHLSTQAATFNASSIPRGISRVIMPRESSRDEISRMSQVIEAEVFVHGALCVSFSGMCLFSSMVGGRSANRGRCAQPCRKRYNNKYVLNTKDLCLVGRLPELIEAGASSLKIEGRMRDASYVGTVTRIYRNALDRYANSDEVLVTPEEKDQLYLSFNRGFTEGFAFEGQITDQRLPTNRGLYLGKVKDGLIRLRSTIRVGDGVAIHTADGIRGQTIERIAHEDGRAATEASEGEIVDPDLQGAADYDAVYKTSKPSIDVSDCALPTLSFPKVISENSDKDEEVVEPDQDDDTQTVATIERKPSIEGEERKSTTRLCVWARSEKEARDAEEAGADIIYLDADEVTFNDVRKTLKGARLFLVTPRILMQEGITGYISSLERLTPDGVYAGNRGLMEELRKRGYPADRIHLDYLIYCTNDVDMACLHGIPTLSPELSLEEIGGLSSKEAICMVHGRLTLMTTAEPLRAPELVDDEGRHFPIRDDGTYRHIMNCSPVGLFSKAGDLIQMGIRYLLVDPGRDTRRIVRFYRGLIDGKAPDDGKLVKGYTQGHFHRGVM